MNNNTIPPAIMMLAAASRLLDLHQSRRQSGVYVPDVPESAGRNMGIALMVLETLRSIEIERGYGYVTVEELLELLCHQVTDLGREELDFVLESIAKEREIRYAVPNVSFEFDFGYARDKTRLIEFSDSHAQVKMTGNALLFLRICDDERAWLYDEADAAKIITALEHFKFNDIPLLCRSISLELAKKAKELTNLIERPTRAEQCDILIADGKSISDNLRNTREIVQKAMEMALDNRTINQFQEWAEREKPEFELGNIQAELETLVQSVEAVSRRFIEFLDVAQQKRDVVPSQHRFLEIAGSLVLQCKPGMTRQLEAFLEGVIYPNVPITWFDPSVLPGAVDFYELMDVSEEKVVSQVYDFSARPSQTAQRFRDFVERNREHIYARLEKGPLSFSEFLVSSEYILHPGESPVDFIGIYTSPEMLDGDGQDAPRIVVGFTGRDFTHDLIDQKIITSDPVIFLELKES